MTVCDLGWGDLQQKLCWSDLEYTKTYILYGGAVNLCPGRVGGSECHGIAFKGKLRCSFAVQGGILASFPGPVQGLGVY